MLFKFSGARRVVACEVHSTTWLSGPAKKPPSENAGTSNMVAVYRNCFSTSSMEKLPLDGWYSTLPRR